VRVAFVGKGGSGKTTLSSLLVRYLAGEGLPVIAIDADINQHLAEALGAAGAPPAMGGRLAEIKDYLRGDNPRITSAGLRADPQGHRGVPAVGRLCRRLRRAARGDR
jgi:CO dehydrogenase maturation factor